MGYSLGNTYKYVFHLKLSPFLLYYTEWKKKKKALNKTNSSVSGATILSAHRPTASSSSSTFSLSLPSAPWQLPETVSELPFLHCSNSTPNFINLNIMSNRLNYPTHESWHALPENLIKAKFSVISKIHAVANDGSHDLNVKEVLTSSQHKSHCLYKLKEQLLLFIQNKRFQDSFLLGFTQFYCAQNWERVP